MTTSSNPNIKKTLQSKVIIEEKITASQEIRKFAGILKGKKRSEALLDSRRKD